MCLPFFSVTWGYLQLPIAFVQPAVSATDQPGAGVDVYSQDPPAAGFRVQCAVVLDAYKACGCQWGSNARGNLGVASPAVKKQLATQKPQKWRMKSQPQNGFTRPHYVTANLAVPRGFELGSTVCRQQLYPVS